MNKKPDTSSSKALSGWPKQRAVLKAGGASEDVLSGLDAIQERGSKGSRGVVQVQVGSGNGTLSLPKAVLEELGNPTKYAYKVVIHRWGPLKGTRSLILDPVKP